MSSSLGLSAPERSLLEDALVDDVSFRWVLHHLELPSDVRPTQEVIDAAFAVLARLHREGLIKVGRMERLNPVGDAWARVDRLEPVNMDALRVRHVEEPLDEVRARVNAAVLEVDEYGWQFSCWVVANVEREIAVDDAGRASVAWPKSVDDWLAEG